MADSIESQLHRIRFGGVRPQTAVEVYLAAIHEQMAGLVAAQEALVIHPGDTLVIRVAPNTSPESFAKFADFAKARLAEKNPGVELLVIAAEQLGVIRAAS